MMTSCQHRRFLKPRRFPRPPVKEVKATSEKRHPNNNNNNNNNFAVTIGKVNVL
jgi:hypothetical protein